jgi:hypothetical protein
LLNVPNRSKESFGWGHLDNVAWGVLKLARSPGDLPPFSASSQKCIHSGMSIRITSVARAIRLGIEVCWPKPSITQSSVAMMSSCFRM